jgi:alanine racemase
MRAANAAIDTGAITRNLMQVRQRADHARVLAVVKADGYGHGLERVARALSGADAFGVASIDDAERLRALGMNHRIVLLSGFDEAADLSIVRALDLDCVLHHPHQLQILQHEARGARAIRAWIKFDTGMHRLGFPISEANLLLAHIATLPQVQPELTLMTHFSSADEVETDITQQQIAHFNSALGTISNQVSMANSAGILSFTEARRDWVRPGGILYGLSTIGEKTGADLGFQPAMRFTSKLVASKQLQAGDRVGYAGSYIAKKPMRIGIAAVGYGDGYPRHAPSGTPVMVAGKLGATVGRVSMDLLAIDISAIPGADVGSEVVLWGPELPAEIIAQHAGTISYELTCGLTRRVRFSEG